MCHGVVGLTLLRDATRPTLLLADHLLPPLSLSAASKLKFRYANGGKGFNLKQWGAGTETGQNLAMTG